MSANPAQFIYGTVVVGALLATESARRETYLETVAAVALALLLYWLAHAYAEFTTRRIRGTAQPTPTELGRSMAHEAPLLLGALLPLLVLLLCWVAHAQLTTAVTIGIWTSAGIALVEQVVAALRERGSTAAVIRQSAIGLSLGLLVIGIKLVLH
jgi:Na+-translocating ferredoxin:NAD+ oxidoreductase RnfA subunit